MQVRKRGTALKAKEKTFEERDRKAFRLRMDHSRTERLRFQEDKAGGRFPRGEKNIS